MKLDPQLLPKIKDESVEEVANFVETASLEAKRHHAAIIELMTIKKGSVLKIAPPSDNPLAIEKIALLAVIFDDASWLERDRSAHYSQKMESICERLGIVWSDVIEFSKHAAKLKQMFFSES